MTVESEGYSPQFEDRTGGILNIQTREGSRDQIHWRATISVPDAGLLAEEPLGRKHKGSWLVSARKSYLQYFLAHLAQDLPSMAFGYSDTQVQLNYHFSDSNAVSLKIIDGPSSFDRSSARNSLGLNAAMLANYRYTLANFGWLYTPSRGFVANSHAAFMRERFDDSNVFNAPLAAGFYGEWVARSDATWSWRDDAKLQFGAEARSTRGDGFSDYYWDPSTCVPTESHRGSAVLAGGYLQQSWSSLPKRLSLTLGGRWDRINTSGISTFSPQAALAFQPWSGRDCR